MNKFLYLIPKALRLFLCLNVFTTSAFAVAPTTFFSDLGNPATPATTATVGVFFSYTITADNFPTTFAATSLPAGLSHVGGVISGIPEEDTDLSGPIEITIAAGNTSGIITDTLNLTIVDLVPSITPPLSTASGNVGLSFSYQIIANHFPDIFTIIGLDAFDGLSYDPYTGTIQGTPTAGKSGDVIIEATNSAGTGYAILTIDIASPQIDVRPVIISPLSAAAVVGQNFEYQIETQLNAPVNPITYAATSLPAGLSHDGNGLISGTPVEDTLVSGPIQITIAASNAHGIDTQTLSLTIEDLVPSITSSSAASGNAGSSFSYTITADNEPDTFSVTGLDAFDGLVFDPLTVEISGTPTSQLVADVIIEATNSAGTGYATLTIDISSPLPPAIISPLSATAVVGDSTFSYQIETQLIAPLDPITYTATSLPPGLSHDGNGLISGTPVEDTAVSGPIEITIAASNANGIDTQTLSLTIEDLVPSITSSSAASGNADSSFSYTITAGNEPDTFNVTGLDAFGGLVFDPLTGEISGTPTSQLVADVIIEATNSAGTSSAILTIDISSPLPPVIISPLSATAVVGDSTFSYQIETQLIAPVDPITYAATSLPPGLSHDGNGLISGTPAEDTAVSGPIQITIAASNDYGIDTQTLSLTIVDLVPSITSPSTASGNVGSSFSYTITADNEPDTFSVTGLDAFGGLVFDPLTGEISGTPTSELVADVIIEATNSAGTDSATLTIDTASAQSNVPSITSSLVEEATKGVAYSYTIFATNSPTSYGLSGDDLPNGLVRNGALISGSPTETGVFNLLISASNEAGTSVIETLKLTVVEPAPVINSGLIAGGEVGLDFTYQITADNTPTSFQAYGLGAIGGLVFDPATGEISGSPLVSGDFDVTIVATNLAGSDTELLRIIVIPDIGAGGGPTVEIISIGGEVLATTPIPEFGFDFDSDTNNATLPIVANVTTAGVEPESVFVRWMNPPSTAGSGASILVELMRDPDAGPNAYSGEITVGFNPKAREIGGGSIDLVVVATQGSGANVLFGRSGLAVIEVKPLIQLLFPSESVLKEINIGEVFSSVRLNTNAFASIEATISGVDVNDTITDNDSTDNLNGVFNFLSQSTITFPGDYNVEILATDSLNNTDSVIQKITIDNSPSGPVAVVGSPDPGFTNEIFSPATFTWEQDGAPQVDRNGQGVVTRTTYTYLINQVSEGSGYYPRSSTSINLPYNFLSNSLPGTAQISENTIVEGRLPLLSDSVDIVFQGVSSGFGFSGNGVVDSYQDPGEPAQITLSAQFFRGDAALVSFKMFVNGKDVTPGNGNLDADNGAIDVPVLEFSGSNPSDPSSGAPAPGKYVFIAQVTDQDGNVATSKPRPFEIEPYEPLEITLSRSVAAGAATAPILVGGSATFLANVSPVAEADFVEFFDSNSGAKLGDGSKVTISGNTLFRAGIIFEQAGEYKVFARATGFSGQTISSAPVDLKVEAGESPVVTITAPSSGSNVPAGSNLEILIDADDPDPDGQITVVEVFNGSTTNSGNSLGLATPTGVPGKYRLNFTPTVADAGVLNLIARATDDLGNSTDSDVALIGVVVGAVPVIEILSPAVQGTEFFVGQPFEIRARITDPTPGGSITSATLTDVNFYTRVEGVNGTIIVASDSISFNPQNDVMSQSSTADEYVYMATINSPDVVGLVITATDNSGNVTESAPFEFTVTNGIVPDVEITVANSTVLGEVSVEPLLAGVEYEILTVGTTDFATLGPVMVNEADLIPGQTYQIVTAGTDSDFTSAGALNNAVGTVFTAGPIASTGSGTAIDISVGTVFTYNGTAGAGTGTVLRSIANATHSNVIAVEPLIAGVQYEILTAGIGTNWAALDANPVLVNEDELIPGKTYQIVTAGTGPAFTSAGALNNAVGTVFTAGPIASTGSGTAIDISVGTVFTYNGTDGSGTGTVRISGAIPADLASVVTLEINASDADGNVSQVEVLNNGIPEGFASLVRVDSTVDPIVKMYRFDSQASSPGLLNFQARAADNYGNIGLSNLAKVTVVTGAIPTAVITSPANGTSITAGKNIEILVTADDIDGQVTSVEVYNNGFPSTLVMARPTGNANEYLVSFPTSPDEPGNINLAARVTDNQGNVGFSKIVPINVVLGAVPQIDILSPEAGQEFFINQPFVIRARITDADGTITSAIFARDQQLRTERQIDNNGVIRLVIIEASRSFNGDEVMVATATADEYQFMATLDTPDLVGLQIIATDDDGNVSVSREIQFTVTNGIAPDVAITAPLDKVRVDALITDEKYEILTAGIGTNWAALDADPVLVNEDELIPGKTYQIVTAGTGPAFTSAGALNNAVGTVFTAGPIASTGSGTAIDISVGTVFTSDGTIGAGTGTVRPVYDRGDIVAIDIDASDSDGSISEVKVFNGSTELGTANIVSNGKYRYNYIANAVGRINLNAQARDDLGNTGISNIETITIVSGDIPTVGITLPGGTSYTAGDIITIDVDADDTDGSVTSVEIFNGDVSLGTASKVSETKYRLNLQTSLTDLGDLQLSARATDDSGNVSMSTFVEAKVVIGEVPVVTIDSPGAVSTFNYGNVIPFVITASDPDGSISSVSVSHLDNGTATALGQALKVDSVSDDQYRYSLNTAVLTAAGTKFISVSAVDNRGNVSTDVVEIRLDVVPFSVNFVTQTATDTASDSITTPITSPYVIQGASNEYVSATSPFTVEIGGIDASTLASLDWKMQLDDGSAAVSVSETLVAEATEDGQAVAEVASSTYTQSFEFSGTGTLTVTATNSDGVAVQNSLTVFVDLPEPDTDQTDFVNYIYDQFRGLVPSAVELQDAINTINNTLGGDTPASRAAFAATLFTPNVDYGNSQFQAVALVYKTLTGQWPTQTQLETGLGIISQDTTVQSSQTVSTQEGSITAGGTQTLSFNYSAGDQVTITVTGDGTNANPLTDATLTVRAPDGSFVGYSDDNFFSGNFSLDPVLSFVASQTGAHTATVGGYFSSLSGGFAVTSASTAIESNTDTLAARALVAALKDTYNGAYGFLADADTDSFNLSPAFVAQIYLNKHGVGITSWNSSMLGARMTGVDENMGSGYIFPGYQGDVVNFVADFALDVDLATGLLASTNHPDGYPYSGTLYYGRPNNPLSAWDQARVAVQSDANLSFALRALLGTENPTQTLDPTDTVYTFTPPDEEDPVNRTLNEFMALTLEEALAEIFASAEFAAQFAGDTTVVDTDFDGTSDYFELLLGTDPSDGSVAPTATDSSVAQTMIGLGVVDPTKVAAEDDADGDGVSNYAEIQLSTDPSDGSFAPTAADSLVAQTMIGLGVVDPIMIVADYDYDGDGVSNYAEILLNADPSAIASSATSGQASTEVIGNATYFVMEFVRLKSSLTPSGASVVVECADETFTFTPVVDLESNLSLSVDQSGISSDYERVEYRVDTSSTDCNFFRLSVQ